MNKIVKATQASTLNTVCKFFDDDYYGKRDITKMSDEELDELCHALDECGELKEIFGSIKTISKVLKYGTTVEDLVYKLAKLKVISTLSYEYADVLNRMAANTSDLAMSAACMEMADICSNYLTEEEMFVILASDFAITELTNYVMGELWDEVVKAITPYGLAIKAGQAVGKWSSELFFSTDTSIETFYEMSALYDFENVLRKTVADYAKNCKSANSVYNAKHFNASFEMLMDTFALGCDISQKWITTNYQTGWANLFVTYLTGKNEEYEKYKTSLSNIKKDIQFVSDFANGDLYNCYVEECSQKIVVELSLDSYKDSEAEKSDGITNDFMKELQVDIWRTCNLTITEDMKLTDDITTYGDLIIKNGTLDLNGHTLNVEGSCYHSGGTLELGANILNQGGRLNVNGDYRLQSSSIDEDTQTMLYTTSKGNIKMDGEDDYICIEGNFFIQGKYSTYSAGVLEVKGNFTELTGPDVGGSYTTSYCKNNFAPSDTHKVLLSGENRQTVSFENPSTSYFNDLEMENENVEFISEIKGWTLKRDTVFGNGIKNSINGTFDLASHVMTVKGDFLQGNGTVDINGGKLLVSGDYCIIGGTDKAAPYSSAGIVDMDGESDYICVDGNFIIKGKKSVYSAGVLEIKGDFTELTGPDVGGSYATSYCKNNFAPSDTHKVLLSGENKQTVSFENPSTSYFNEVEIKNENIDFISKIKICSGILQQDTTFGRGLPHGFVGSLDMNGHNLIINGDFLQSEGEFNTNGGNLTVTGNFNKTGGNINLAPGNIIVEGNFTNEKGDIIATTGDMSVDGDFKQQAETITLSSKSPLTVGGTYEHTGGTINMNSAIAEIGSIKLGGGTFSGNGGTVTIDGDSVITGGTLNLDNAVLTNKGSLTQTGGVVNFNQGTLNVQKDYVIESETYDKATDTTSKSNSNGYINMQYAADKLNVDGDFIMHSGVGHNGYLKAGTITLKGDFHQIAGSDSNFYTTGANTVVFAGTKKQKISFDC